MAKETFLYWKVNKEEIQNTRLFFLPLANRQMWWWWYTSGACNNCACNLMGFPLSAVVVIVMTR
jgi:hypothetical protein